MLLNTHLRDDKAHEETLAAFKKALGIEDSWSEPAYPLPNMVEKTESDFWGWRTSHSFSAEAWTSQRRYEGTWGHLLIYFVNHGHLLDGGFAVLVLRNDYPQPKTIKYYEWRACAHEFETKNIGNCLNRYTCKKCGASYDVDSSG